MRLLRICRMRGIFFLAILAIGFARTSFAALVYTDLYDFTGGLNDGANPLGSFLQVGSVLYGMTKEGSSNGDGTILSYNILTNTEELVYSFAGHPTDGTAPEGTLIQSVSSSSTLYGITSGGGAAEERRVVEQYSRITQLTIPKLYSHRRTTNFLVRRVLCFSQGVRSTDWQRISFHSTFKAMH